MPRTTIMKLIAALILPLIALGFGFKLHDPLKLHTSKFEGVWKGQSVITLNNTPIESFATIIVDNNGIRLSVNNRSGDYNYTYDASLILHIIDAQYTRLEIIDREITGLEAFQKDVGVNIPAAGTLMELSAWRLEDDRLFFNINFQGVDQMSYVLTKTR